MKSPTWKDKCFLLLGYKEWSNLEKNQQLKPLKDDLYSKVGAFLGSNYANNVNNQRWLNEFGNKKLLHSLDIHSFSDLDTFEFDENGHKKASEKYYCNTWIKGDPTFEGLKQIMYEPNERVRIQEVKPDQKRGYQVIDSVTLMEDKFWNETIYFNDNLNTIIGGRSTGKSTLLKSIAKKINNKVKFDDEKDFIKNHLNGISVRWNDGEEEIERDIDFFPQSYMHDIAKNKEQTDELISNIIRKKEESKFLNEYETKNDELKKSISKNLVDIFQLQADLEKSQLQLKEKGDRRGVETEIQKLETKIAELSNNSTISKEELEQYKDSLKAISENELLVSLAENDLKMLPRMKITSVIKASYADENGFNNLSFPLNRDELFRSFENLKMETEGKWVEIVERFEKSTEEKKDIHISRIEQEKRKTVYQKGTSYYNGNKEISDIQHKLKEEQQKLQEIKAFEEKIGRLNLLKDSVITQITRDHNSYYTNAHYLIENVNISHEGVKIAPHIRYKEQELRSFLENRLNQRGLERQSFIADFIKSYENDIAGQINLMLTKALNREIDYKNYNSNEQVMSELLSTNWFDISFELSYQNDVFDEMSQGKQAFVILKLLLEFSSKECPILIDQPEDSLDNRAIYNELVQYLRTKKKQRQVILVTHNPNVVVSADAENVIVANQNGKNCANANNIKFQYINGALENTKVKNETDEVILTSQGIREHVCEILEGGKWITRSMLTPRNG